MTQTIRKVDRGIYFEWINGIGLRHNEDGPAVEYKGGQYKDWQINGEYHRLGAPARIWASGMEEWYFNGKLHREDGPAAISREDNDLWYYNGERLTLRPMKSF